MPLEIPPVIDVSLGVSEQFPPLILSSVAQPAYREAGLDPSHVARLSDLIGLTLSREDIVLTTGASQGLLVSILHALNSLPVRPKKIVTFLPFYPGYRSLSDLTGLPLVCLPIGLAQQPELLAKEFDTHAGAIWLVNTPHNPTGLELALEDLKDMADKVSQRGGQLIWDAAYLGVTRAPDRIAPILSNAITVGSFSKLLGLAGERVGFVTGPADAHSSLAKAQWGLGLSAPSTGVSMVRSQLDTLGPQHIAASHEAIATNRSELAAALASYGAKSQAKYGPFLWCEPFEGSAALIDMFAMQNVAIATGAPFGADDLAFRINLMISRSNTRDLIRRLAR